MRQGLSLEVVGNLQDFLDNRTVNNSYYVSDRHCSLFIYYKILK